MTEEQTVYVVTGLVPGDHYPLIDVCETEGEALAVVRGILGEPDADSYDYESSNGGEVVQRVIGDGAGAEFRIQRCVIL